MVERQINTIFLKSQLSSLCCLQSICKEYDFINLPNQAALQIQIHIEKHQLLENVFCLRGILSCSKKESCEYKMKKKYLFTYYELIHHPPHPPHPPSFSEPCSYNNPASYRANSITMWRSRCSPLLLLWSAAMHQANLNHLWIISTLEYSPSCNVLISYISALANPHTPVRIILIAPTLSWWDAHSTYYVIIIPVIRLLKIIPRLFSTS